MHCFCAYENHLWMYCKSHIGCQILKKNRHSKNVSCGVTLCRWSYILKIKIKIKSLLLAEKRDQYMSKSTSKERRIKLYRSKNTCLLPSIMLLRHSFTTHNSKGNVVVSRVANNNKRNYKLREQFVNHVNKTHFLFFFFLFW